MKRFKEIIYIILFSFCSLILQGCRSEKIPERISEDELIVSSESDAITDETNRKDGKQLDWLEQKIRANSTNEWSKAIDENKQYIFILTTDNQILKVDKHTKKSTVIIECENEHDIFFLNATEEELYYQVDDLEIYKYNLVNGKITKVFASERDVDSIFGLQIYKNKMYLYMSGLRICKFDLKTKKTEEMMENVSDAVIFDDKLFFIKRKKNNIYCLNLENNKSEIVRRKKEKMRNLFIYKNKLCYSLSGKKQQIYAYSLKGQDELLISLKANRVWNICDSYTYVYSYDKDILYYVYEEAGNSYLCTYTGKKGNVKMRLPEDYVRNGCICSGYFFYQASTKDGKNELGYYKSVLIEDMH
jgi:hypothetical protein